MHKIILLYHCSIIVKILGGTEKKNQPVQYNVNFAALWWFNGEITIIGISFQRVHFH